MSAKVKLTVAVVLAFAIAAFIFIKFFFVFGEGVKAGELNQFMYKGWIWKTYEGRLIQTGFRSSGNGNAGIQSNEFNFSVQDKEVADSLMRCSGKMVELRYKEYRGALPWRGVQRKVVTEILSVQTYDNHMQVVPITGEN